MHSHKDTWAWLKDLNFISVFFTWLFLLLSRLAEPLMSLSALYIIVATGIPAITNTALLNLTEGCLIAAPEIILPGAFVIAATERAKGNAHARLLSGMSWLFVALTAFTLLDLFVLHLSGIWLATLMCARCTAGVGYSILIRVITHSDTTHDTPLHSSVAPVVDSRVDDLVDELATLKSALAALTQDDSQHDTESDNATGATEECDTATAENDTLSSRIAGYLMEYPGATQRDIATACNTTVRTVQRHQKRQATAECDNATVGATVRQLRVVQ